MAVIHLTHFNMSRVLNLICTDFKIELVSFINNNYMNVNQVYILSYMLTDILSITFI